MADTKPPMRPAAMTGLAIALLVAVLAGGAVLFSSISGAPRIGGDNPQPIVRYPGIPGIGGPFELSSQTGAKVTDKDLLGKPTLMFFGYTHCPDVCPTTLFQMSEVFRALGPDPAVNAVFVTVDPERDTPSAMKDYLSSFDPHITGLTGSREAVDKMLRSYRVYSRKVPGTGDDYTMDHSALVYLMDKQGQFVAAFNLDRPPAEAASNLRKYM